MATMSMSQTVCGICRTLEVTSKSSKPRMGRQDRRLNMNGTRMFIKVSSCSIHEKVLSMGNTRAL